MTLFTEPAIPVEYDAFAATYDLETSGATADVDFYRALALEADGPVLELAVGTGRVAVPIAQAGVPVVGLDHSAEMLAIARGKAASLGLDIELHQVDMRHFHLGRQFGLVYCPARAFLHLLEPEDHMACLRAVQRHLQPGGRFAVNVFVPSIPLIAAHLSAAPPWELDNEFEDPQTGHRFIVSYALLYEPFQQRVTVRHRYDELDETGRVVRSEYKTYTLCWIWPREFEHLLARCGFDVEALYGDFDGTPFGPDSREQVWVARRG